MKTNHNQVVFAREYRGYSQTELASRIKGLSQPTLSKFEKGIGAISDDILKEIAIVLNFPLSFFELEIFNKSYTANYRKKRITKTVKDQLDKRNKLYGYLVDKLKSGDIEFPPLKFKSIDLTDGYTPRTVAQHLRQILGLKYHPIKDIITILENNGIIVIEDNSDVEEFDGVSFITDEGNYIIIINKNFSNDRKRFTLAHELGHLIMHNTMDCLIDEKRDIEKEANQFASEFLMPEDEIKRSLYGLRISDLAGLKQYWLTSMASILFRAKDLKCIDDRRATYLNIELSRSGFKKKEPIDVAIDKPFLFKEAYKLFINELNYTIEDMANFFSISKEDTEDIFEAPKRFKLRLTV